MLDQNTGSTVFSHEAGKTNKIRVPSHIPWGLVSLENPRRPASSAVGSSTQDLVAFWPTIKAVSYTHLTLPTN